jgi:hypothetical protein
MNKIIKTAVLASAGLAIASSSAMAASSYNDQDVLLSFFKSGASSDLIVDLGPVSQYTPGTSFDLSTVGFSAASLLTQFAGNLNGVTWTAFAGNDLGAKNQVWATTASPTPIANANLNAIIVPTDAAINSFGGNDIGGTAATPVVGTTTEFTVATSYAFSATVYQGSHSGKIDGKFSANTDLAASGSFVSTGYFDDVAAGTGPSTLLGDFTINATTGDAQWNGAPVPEPAAYGLLAGAGLLALSLRRQFSGQVA